MRKGQSVYFVFKDNEVLLDSQLRPRMYQSKETAEKNRYKWEDGAELVEYVPIKNCRIKRNEENKYEID